ncbi:hypothetical protein VUR80DRAFT_3392 [Thermomyces stellatus]
MPGGVGKGGVACCSHFRELGSWGWGRDRPLLIKLTLTSFWDLQFRTWREPGRATPGLRSMFGNLGELKLSDDLSVWLPGTGRWCERITYLAREGESDPSPILEIHITGVQPASQYIRGDYADGTRVRNCLVAICMERRVARFLLFGSCDTVFATGTR